MTKEISQILEEEIARTLDPRRKFLLKNHKASLEAVEAKWKRAERLLRKVEAAAIRSLKVKELKFSNPEVEAEFDQAVMEAEGFNVMTEH